MGSEYRVSPLIDFLKKYGKISRREGLSLAAWQTDRDQFLCRKNFPESLWHRAYIFVTSLTSPACSRRPRSRLMGYI